jgi:3',5'-cyclic AMP phosphodiesterase CpdA
MCTVQNCAADDQTTLTGIRVSPEYIALAVGGRDTVRATPIPEGLDVAFHFVSSNTAVATVSVLGAVTVVGEGEAVITVSSGQVSASVSVVGLGALNVRRSTPFTTYIAGDTLQLNANVGDVVWSSSDENVAQVSALGLVRFTGAGLTTITARAGTDAVETPLCCVGESTFGAGALRFAVVSDTHFGNSAGQGPMFKVPQALRNLMTQQPTVDAIIDVGDITDHGDDGQYKQLLTVFGDETVVPRRVARYFLMGNHDNMSGAPRFDNYLNNIRQPLHQYFAIKGTPFITVSQTGTDKMDFDSTARKHLSASLYDAAQRFVGKPIFVFIHIPPENTCYGSTDNEGWGTPVFNDIYAQYPQIILFAGHSHYPLGDPRSIWQDAYTAVNDGSTTYSEVEAGVVSEGIHPPEYANVTEGVIVNILPDGDVELERHDTYRNEEILPRWTVRAPHDGSRFTYNNRDGLPSPEFAADAKPRIDVGNADCTVRFPQAKDNDAVFRYAVDLLTDDGAVIASFIKFSQFYLNSRTPDSLAVDFGLNADMSSIRARVTAYDSYNNASAPIISDTVAVSFAPVQPPSPVAQWLFDDADNPARATTGVDLQFVGNGVASVSGTTADGGAVSIAADTYIRATHGIAANGGGTRVNEYSLMFDFSVTQTNSYNCIYQTNLANTDDGDLFISSHGSIGISNVYSGKVETGRWHRLTVSVRVGTKGKRYFLDGRLINAIDLTERDSRFALDPAGVLFFADNDGERLPLSVARIAVWDKALSAAEAAGLGTAE